MLAVAAKLGDTTMPPREMTSREIAQDVADRIAVGQHAPGTKLPYEDLIELYGVSRSTIQRAMARLEAQGVVEYRPGRGMYVRGDHPE